MAGNIQWFRWHHGSVTDPKFKLIAHKAKQSLATVIAVWAFLLEQASASDERGAFGEVDCESLDCLLGLDDGATAAIMLVMEARGLVEGGSVSAWEKRQPKRERVDENSTERSRAFRQKKRQETPEDNDATPSNATQHQETPRVEKRREEKKNNPQAPKGADVPPGFAEFWKTWPSNDRKQAKGKCLDAWKKAHAERDAALVLAHVESLKSSASWMKNSGEFIPAPLVYLNQRRWEGAESVAPATADVWAGAVN